MGNRFATLPQYHRIVLAHGIMGALIFLLLVPVSVMLARFYAREPGYAVVYHAQLQVFSGLLLLAVFILGFFAVGPERNLTNPHHGIGVAIFVLFILQLVGGRLVRHITKMRSLRIMIHQWSGRAIALLGIVQVPLGLTLYGSPKYLFILYTLWMSFLLLVYFILSYRAEGRREFYHGGARSEAGRTRVTESEYFSQEPRHEKSGWMKWLGPLAAGAGIWALMRGRKKNKERDYSPSRSRSFISSRGPEVLPSRHGSASYVSEKYSEPPRKSGGGFMKVIGTAAAAIGAGKLVSGMMNRRNDRRDEEYSAVSTETPRRHNSRRDGTTLSEFSSDYTDYPRRQDETQTSLLPPSAPPPGRGGPGRPVTPQPLHSRGRGEYEDSDYSSYVSPSRRQQDGGRGGGLAKGILGGLGMGWFAKKLADRRSRKEDDRIRDEEDMRSGLSGSRFTGDGYPSPSRRDSRRPPPVRRATGHPGTSILSETDMTESSIEPRNVGSSYTAGPTSTHTGTVPPIVPVPVPGSGGRSRSRSRSRARSDSVSMPPMPGDPHGILHSEADSQSQMSSIDSHPQRRPSERRRRAGERAAAKAAARAGGLAASERERYGSPSSQPVSVKVKMHDDRDRNVTLRRLTEEEQRAGSARARTDSESSEAGLGSPSNGRGYRRDSSQRRAERSAERRVESDQFAPLSPPHPAFAKGSRRPKDSAYYSGQPQPGQLGSSPMGPEAMSSMGSGTGTWSQMSPSPSGPGKGTDSVAADDRRRRRRLERRGAGSARPSESDMFD